MIRETADACYDNETCPTNVHRISNIDENCALLGYYAASSGNSLPTFRDNLSVPSSKVKNLANGSLAEFFNRIRIRMGIFLVFFIFFEITFASFFYSCVTAGVLLLLLL
jgi:hypothetical protein